MTQQKSNAITPSRLIPARVVFLRKRIASFETEASGAGKEEREHCNRMIKNHEAEIQELIEVMADECIEEYKNIYSEELHLQQCWHREGGV